MLACPPTRLSLTASDIADFEQKCAQRQAAPFPQNHTRELRLQLGAGHLTKAGFVPARANTGQKRAESCSSQATVCTEGGAHTSGEGSPTFIITDTAHKKGYSYGVQNHQQQTPRKQGAHTRTVNHVHQSKSNSCHALPLSGVRAPTELNNEELQNTRRLPLRARELPADRHRGTNHISATFSLRSNHDSATWNTERSHHSFMDPGAAVFIPRTQFAHSTISSIERSTDTANGASYPNAFSSFHSRIKNDLRIESRSEHDCSILPTTGADPGSSISIKVAARPAADSSRATIPAHDWTGQFQSCQAQQSSDMSCSQSTSKSMNPSYCVASPRPISSRQHLATLERSMPQQRIPSFLDLPMCGQQAQSHAASNINLRPISPAPSANSRSTPNLLGAATTYGSLARRGSLSSRNRTRSPLTEARKTSEQSRASEIDKAPTEEVSFEQRWLNKNSPLDELAQKFNNLMARPRSVGRSFQQTSSGHGKSFLLTGDPFQIDHSPQRWPWQDSYGYLVTDTMREYQPHNDDNNVSGKIIPDAHCAGAPVPGFPELKSEHHVSQVTTPPSPPLASSPANRSPLHRPDTVSVVPREWRTYQSKQDMPKSTTFPTSSPERNSSDMSLSGAATPTAFAVYDDKKPSDAQPRTPADLTRSTRRSRGYLDASSMHHSAAKLRTLASVRNPVGHTSLWYNYPTTSSQTTLQEEGTAQLGSVYRDSDVVAHRQRSSVYGQERSINSSENDIEENLDGLIEDQRIWMRRRGSGTLDVTPPREGRFERYLS